MKKIIVGLMIVGLIAGTMYHKANVTRECEIVGVYISAIMVKHPNGHLYTMHMDNVKQYTEGQTIEVVFDELCEWDTQIEIKGLR